MTKKTKRKYKIRNWPKYKKSLIQRGSITLWFSEESREKWYSKKQSGVKGRREVYSDEAIVCALLIRTVYHLPLRALQGFMHSIVTLLCLDISVVSYTQICRRSKKLGEALQKLSNRRPHDIVFDSTGLKVYGEGEWKVRQHGVSKKRTWRKLHIGLDPKSREIMIAELTCNGTGSGDGEIAKSLIPKLPKGVERIIGDGAYNGIGFREEGTKIGAEVIVPPPKGSTVHIDAKSLGLINRNDAVLEIQGLGGDDDARKCWKILKRYHIRSLVETGMYRLKQLTGGSLRSIEFERQKVEGYIKCAVLNKMTKLGMPKGEWIKVA